MLNNNKVSIFDVNKIPINSMVANIKNCMNNLEQETKVHRNNFKNFEKSSDLAQKLQNEHKLFNPNYAQFLVCIFSSAFPAYSFLSARSQSHYPDRVSLFQSIHYSLRHV